MRVPQTVAAEFNFAPNTVDKNAIDLYLQEHGSESVPEFLVLIPAFNEAKNLPAVAGLLENAKEELLSGRIVVCIDGATDETESVSRGLGFGVCVANINRGQGAVLKMGYQLAIAVGAKYVVIVDADGQWDPSDLGAILNPLRQQRADFVQGSRELGETRVGDSFRDFGVMVFAKVISLITGVRVTDTSSGYRAFDVSLLSKIRLGEPQFQSSELLIGAIMAGARILEIPTIMHKRPSGKSKKGNNFSYGINYSKVVLGTWLRERYLVKR